MARSGTNALMHGVRGMINKQVVFKKRRGKRYVAAAPNVDEDREATPGEQRNRNRFKWSNEYATEAIKDDATKKMYAAAANRRQSAHNVAMSDAFYPPKILGVLTHGYTGAKGNVICVQATDNFRVVAVKVSVYDIEGVLIEEGNAVDNADGFNWMYTVTVDALGSKVVVRAYDLPENETVKELRIG